MNAPMFELTGVDGKSYSPVTARGDKGLLVMFICNHCPYVKRVIDGIVRDCKALAPLGIGSIAVMSNDPTDYPEDSLDNMKRVAREKGFAFPYVIDESQEVAHVYGTVCTISTSHGDRCETTGRHRAEDAPEPGVDPPVADDDQVGGPFLGDL